MRLCVVLLLFGASIATPITTRQDLLGRYQQHSLHRLKRFSFWPFSRKKDATTTSTTSTTTTTTTEVIIPLNMVSTIPTPTSGANEVREDGSSRGFWGNLNPFRGFSNLVKKGYEKVKNSTVGQAIRNSSVGRAFRSGRNATSRGLILIGRTMRSGARSVGRAVRKIKRRLTGEEKYRYFVEQVRGGVERGDKNTLAMLDKLGINITIDEEGVARTVVRNDTPTATEILQSEGFFHHNTSGESTDDGINGTSVLTNDSKGSGDPTVGDGWPTTSTTSSPVTTISTTSTTTATSRTTTSVTTRAITSLPITTLRTLSTTTTTKSSPSTITLHTTSWPITSLPTTTPPIITPPKNGGRDTNIEQPLEECGQQWCVKNALTTSDNTTDNIDSGDESASNETDSAETDEEVFNSTSFTEGVSSKLTPTAEYTILTLSPGKHEIVNRTADSTVLLASNTSSSPDEAVFIALLPEHSTDDFEATDSVMTATAKASLSVVETSTTESVPHLPVAFIPTSSPSSGSTSSPTATVDLITTTVTLPITSPNNSTVLLPATSTTEPPQVITTQPTFVQTLPQDLTSTSTQKTSTTFTARSVDSLTSPPNSVITSTVAVPMTTSPPTVAIVTIPPTEPVVSSVTAPPAVPTVTSSTSSTFESTTPLILTFPITSTTLAPITTSTLPITSSTTATATTATTTTATATATATATTTTTPPPTTMLVTIGVTNSLPITTTTISPPTTTLPTTIMPITSPPTTTIPTTGKPTTPSPTTTTLRPTPPPIPPSVTDTLAGVEGEQDGPGGNDGAFPSPFGPPTDDAGFPSPFGGSGGDDEFPDVFNNKGVRDRLREIYEKGDFSHDDLRNAFNFDPNDYHYYYDYGN